MNGKILSCLVNLPVRRLSRISPSRYTATRECLLREVWAACGHKALLPLSAAAQLGGVIHRLFEEAGKGSADNASLTDIDRLWMTLVAETEASMSRSWLDRPQVPLSLSVPDYEVRRRRATSRASDIARLTGHARSAAAEPSQSLHQFEFWVETEDRAVGGRIDAARTTPEGVVLSDYKSGTVLEKPGTDGIRKLKENYREQLEIYAALYQCKYRHWPVSLELVPLQGDPVVIPYTPEHAAHLLEAARQFLTEANAKIDRVEQGGVDISSLACPLPGICRYCLFRPACSAYWVARERQPDDKWPHDAQGTLTGRDALSKGTGCLWLALQGDGGEVVRIRHVTDSVKRHPALEKMKAGCHVAAYGLALRGRSRDYSEAVTTVFYVTA